MIPIYAPEQLSQKNTQAPLEGEQTTSGLSHPPPLSLYIHMPWCIEKCPYCDFNSHKVKQEVPESDYIDALIADLEAALPMVWGRKLESIFFGGGTPSLFSAESIERLLTHILMVLPTKYNAEITMEANPGTIDIANFSGYRAAGVNRVSLGIQSFQDHYLKKLGRIHYQSQAFKAAEFAIKTFHQVNLDVMYALPDQTLEDSKYDLVKACELAPTHLSFYHLTIEPNTGFARNVPENLPEDNLSAEMQEQIEATLNGAGYEHYETSGFAKPNNRCAHNLNYWTFGDYLGIGAGAHSKLSFHDKIIRQTRYQQPNRYMENAIKGQAINGTHTIARNDLSFEFMINALRLVDGVPASLFQQRTGIPLISINSTIKKAIDKGLLHPVDTHIKPTALGQRFLNDLLAMFLD